VLCDADVAHASHLIETVSGQGSAEWATENFAVPMGLPDLYKEDGDHTDIGGGQMMSCTDMLKVGQLVLNKGKWKEMAKEGGSKVVQLVSEEYTKELMKPQHPQFLKNYGLLTWLNTESGPGIADCCSAQWCQRWSGATDPNGRIPGSGERASPLRGIT
jgi:CubicO group peptidase (beta-lactamase class C family)